MAPTRLTPDSLRYLLASNDLVLTEGLREMNATDLVTRQIGLPVLQSLSDLVGRHTWPRSAPYSEFSASVCSPGWPWRSPVVTQSAGIA